MRRCRERAEAIRAALPGDWLWVAPDAPAQPCCTPQALQTLLGREFRHAIFDAWQGFDAAAFAALSGTLQAGSWLLLLMPPYETWESRPDTDSLRWSDCAQPIPTPQFAQHLKRTLPRSANAALATAPAVLLAILSFPWTLATRHRRAAAGAGGYLIAFT